MRAYPLTIEPDDNGTLLVSFVDIPEAHTFADDEDEITARATDCALTALEGYMKDRRPIPAPSRGLTGRAVVLPPLAVAKVELYRSDAERRRAQGRTRATLAMAHAPGRSLAESPPRFSPGASRGCVDCPGPPPRDTRCAGSCS